MAETNSCLVVCIEDLYLKKGDLVLDTRLFITYDFIKETHVVYGKRDNIDRISRYESFFFRSYNTSNFINLIKFIIGNAFIHDDRQYNVILYNYNNMPENVENVDYEFMKNNMNSFYEIAAYDNISISHLFLDELLRMVKECFNFIKPEIYRNITQSQTQEPILNTQDEEREEQDL
jgi:hypothetical protein